MTMGRLELQQLLKKIVWITVTSLHTTLKRVVHLITQYLTNLVSQLKSFSIVRFLRRKKLCTVHQIFLWNI